MTTLHRLETGSRRPRGGAAIRSLAVLDELTGVAVMWACLAIRFANAFGVFERNRFYTGREVWKTSHAPRSMLYEDLERGELGAIRRGSHWLITGASAITWIRSLSEAS